MNSQVRFRSHHLQPLAFVLALAALAFARSANATYSITAVDRATRQVGGAGTSCISGSSVYRIYGSAPGFGAVNSQARTSTAGRDEAVRLLAQGMAPEAIIRRLTDPTFDGDFESRQYGIVALDGQSAGHSGSSTQNYSNDIQGTAEPFAFSMQGNILTGEAVLMQARAAFVDGGGCDMAARLMLALEGGAKNGQGDSRCTPNGIPSDAAYIQVDLPNQPRGSFLYLEVSDTAPQNPLSSLRRLFDTWRAAHPCQAAPPPDAGQNGGSAGLLEAGPVADGSGAVGGATGDSAGGATTTSPGAGEESGCSCRLWRGERSVGFSGAWVAVGLGMLALARAKRSKRQTLLLGHIGTYRNSR